MKNVKMLFMMMLGMMAIMLFVPVDLVAQIDTIGTGGGANEAVLEWWGWLLAAAFAIAPLASFLRGMRLKIMAIGTTVMGVIEFITSLSSIIVIPDVLVGILLTIGGMWTIYLKLEDNREFKALNNGK